MQMPGYWISEVENGNRYYIECVVVVNMSLFLDDAVSEFPLC